MPWQQSPAQFCGGTVTWVFSAPRRSASPLQGSSHSRILRTREQCWVQAPRQLKNLKLLGLPVEPDLREPSGKHHLADLSCRRLSLNGRRLQHVSRVESTS